MGMRVGILRRFCLTAACVVPLLAASKMLGEVPTITVPAGVPLRVEIDHGYKLKVGTQVAGHLLDPVYVDNTLVLPKDARVLGRIAAERPVPRDQRTDALLSGDFTPLRLPEIDFDRIVLPDGSELPMKSRATERTAEVVRFEASNHPHSLTGMIKSQFEAKKDEVTGVWTAPEKMDRLRRFVYGQLPYHPQEVWAQTDFDAELTGPLEVPRSGAGRSWPAMADPPSSPEGVLNARLTTDLTSASSPKGTLVRAVMTAPLLDKTGKEVVLPEGTELTGTVLQSKPARSFGRSGTLRFTFRHITPPHQATQVVHGQVVGAEGASGQNLSIDSEGGVKANPDKGRILAPLALGLLAGKSMDDDGSQVAQGAVVSNGFGVVARIVGMAASDRNVAAGFAYFGFAKSVYKRWIARGHDVAFAHDTRISIELAER